MWHHHFCGLLFLGWRGGGGGGWILPLLSDLFFFMFVDFLHIYFSLSNMGFCCCCCYGGLFIELK